MPRALTPEQVTEFHENGVVRLGQILQPAEVEALSECMERLVFDASGKRQTEFVSDLSGDLDGTERDEVLYSIDFYRRDATMLALTQRPIFLDVARDLLGSNVTLLRDQCFWKRPGPHSKVYLHQDNRYWHLEPPRCVVVWIALDDATVESGCVHYLLGSHKLGRVEHERAGGGRSVLLEACAREEDCVPYEVPRGHGLVHHCQTVHFSPPNRGSRLRRCHTIEYADTAVLQRGIPLPARSHAKEDHDSPSSVRDASH